MGMSMIELVIVIYMLALSGGYGVPLGVPAGEEDPYLHQVAPEECIMYISWSGPESPDPDANPMETWLSQKPVQDLINKFKNAPDDAVEITDDTDPADAYRRLARMLPGLALSQPGCFYIDKAKFADDRWTLKVGGAYVLKLGDRQEEFQKLVGLIGDLPEAMVVDDRYDLFSMLGNETISMAPFRKLEVQGNYLILAFAGEGMELSTDAPAMHAKSGEPKWLTALKTQIPVEQRSSISMIDAVQLNKVLDVPNNGDIEKALDLLGQNDLKSIGWVTGADEQGYVSRTAVRCTDELSSVLTLFDAKPLEQKRLAGIPEGRDFAFASRLSSERLYELISEMAAEVGDKETFERMIGEFEAFAGITLKDDLLRNLDDSIYFYGDFQFDVDKTLIFGFGIRDEMAFLDTLQNFNQRIRQVVEANPNLKMETEEIEKIKVSTVSTVDPGFFWFQSISWAQVDRDLVIGITKEAIGQHIRRLATTAPMVKSEPGQKLFDFAKEAGAEGPVGIMQFDLGELLRMIEPFVGFVDQDEPVMERHEILMRDIPKVPVWRNGLKPHMTGLYRSQDGFQMVQKQVLPGGSLVSNFAFQGLLSMIDVEFDEKPKRATREPLDGAP